MKNHIKNDNGFTLVEVMVSLLITGILMVIVFRFVFDQMHGYQRETMVSDAQQNVRVALDEISRDVRMAGGGIPAVDIYTGQTDLPNDIIYPLYIIQGTTLPAANTANQMFRIASSTANGNDSIIIIYKDPNITNADSVLMQDMTTKTSPIIVSASATGFAKNTPFIVTDRNGTKADLYIVTSAPSISGSNMTLSVATAGGQSYLMYNDTSGTGTGHDRNFNNNASGGADYLGYKAGDRVFAVRVVRYDWSYDLPNDNYPITRLANDDTVRGTDNAIGEFFGSTIVNPTSGTAMDIQWAPFLGTTSAATFSNGMPAYAYNIGVVRITLTARTAIKTSNFANNSLLRTRTLTNDVQPRELWQ